MGCTRKIGKMAVADAKLGDRTQLVGDDLLPTEPLTKASNKQLVTPFD